MGLFDKLFKKQNCTVCGKECGTLGRTKLRDGEYVCNECIRDCSRYVRASEMTKEELLEHMAYMKQQERLYAECFEPAKKSSFPSTGREQSIRFCDEIGMFEIADFKNRDRKNNHELFRYDQVAECEPYVKYGMAKDGAKEKPFEEYGVTITLLTPREVAPGASEEMLKRRSHPYVKHPMTVCLSKDEKEFLKRDEAANIVYKFDYIFGVNDDRKGLFSFGASKNEKRERQAQVDMAKMLSAAMKAAKAGEDSPEMAAAEEQFVQAKTSADAHLTHGLSVYTAAADAAEEKCRN